MPHKRKPAYPARKRAGRRVQAAKAAAKTAAYRVRCARRYFRAMREAARTATMTFKWVQSPLGRFRMPLTWSDHVNKAPAKVARFLRRKHGLSTRGRAQEIAATLPAAPTAWRTR